jgi:hypothetical protein
MFLPVRGGKCASPFLSGYALTHPNRLAADLQELNSALQALNQEDRRPIPVLHATP